jgi:hypothetical protein
MRPPYPDGSDRTSDFEVQLAHMAMHESEALRGDLCAILRLEPIKIAFA